MLQELCHRHPVSIDEMRASRLDNVEPVAWLDQELKPAVAFNAIPNEILTDIFMLSTRSLNDNDSDLLPYTLHNPRCLNKTLLRISCVCRLWRSVALNSALLWALVDASNFDRAKAYLERSRTAMAEIYLWEWKLEWKLEVSSFASLMYSHIDHISRLDIMVPEDTMKALLPLLTFPLSHLQSLRLSAIPGPCIHESELLLFEPAHDEQDLPPRLLSLTNVSIPWNSKIYHSLEVLEVCHIQIAAALSMRTFLNSLQDCPHMHTLRLILEDLTHHNRRPSLRPHQRVELPPLRSLSLRGGSTDIAYVLAHLNILETTSVTLTYDMSHFGGRLFERFLPPDLEGLKFLNAITELTIADDADSSEITVSGRDGSGRKLMDIIVDFKISGGIYNSKASLKALHFVATTFSKTCARISQLAVALDLDKITIQDWRVALRSFPAVQNLTLTDRTDGFKLSGHFIEIFCEALSVQLVSFERPILPQLKFLCLTDVMIGFSFGDVLKTALTTRAQEGTFLQELVIETPYGSPAVIQSLADFAWPDLRGLVEKFVHPEEPE